MNSIDLVCVCVFMFQCAFNSRVYFDWSVDRFPYKKERKKKESRFQKYFGFEFLFIILPGINFWNGIEIERRNFEICIGICYHAKMHLIAR